MKSKARAIKNLFETASLGAPEKAIGFVLWRIVHRYVREVDRTLAEIDLTHLQFTTLAMTAWLGQSGEQVTQTEIAQFSSIHPMQVSTMLASLDSKGLVVRERSVLDVRAKDIGVTTSGLRALRLALPLVIDVQRSMFGEEGKEGGSLLSILLRLERQHSQNSEIGT